ncbi:hypothetical protein ACFQ0M_12335 [Kitasatospora aburaviensis]
MRASTGARAAARCSAAVVLCLRAWSATSTPSGIRNARATIAVTARATPASDRLTGASPS